MDLEAGSEHSSLGSFALANPALRRSNDYLASLSIGGEARFLMACLAKGFNPSLLFVAESHFLLICCFKMLKRKRDFLGYASTPSRAIELLSRITPGIVVIYEAGHHSLYGDVIDYIATSCPDVRTMVVIRSLSTLDKTSITAADSIVADEDILLPVNPLLQALMALVAGATYRSPSVVKYLENSKDAVDSPSPDRILLGLRDHQLLEAYVLGLSNREVAQRLNLSVRTVQTYSGNLLQRLGVNNRQKAIRRAIELGFAMGKDYLKGKTSVPELLKRSAKPN